MLPVPSFPRLSLPWFLFAWIPACSLIMDTGYVAPSKAFQNEPEHEARSPGCTPRPSHSRAVLPGRCHCPAMPHAENGGKCGGRVFWGSHLSPATRPGQQWTPAWGNFHKTCRTCRRQRNKGWYLLMERNQQLRSGCCCPLLP